MSLNSIEILTLQVANVNVKCTEEEVLAQMSVVRPSAATMELNRCPLTCSVCFLVPGSEVHLDTKDIDCFHVGLCFAARLVRSSILLNSCLRARVRFCDRHLH